MDLTALTQRIQQQSQAEALAHDRLYFDFDANWQRVTPPHCPTIAHLPDQPIAPPYCPTTAPLPDHPLAAAAKSKCLPLGSLMRYRDYPSFLNALYYRLLNRAADLNGRQYYLGKLAANQLTKFELIHILYHSDERQAVNPQLKLTGWKRYRLHNKLQKLPVFAQVFRCCLNLYLLSSTHYGTYNLATALASIEQENTTEQHITNLIDQLNQQIAPTIDKLTTCLKTKADYYTIDLLKQEVQDLLRYKSEVTQRLNKHQVGKL